MKERPILFSGPMVRAILEGRKTQTRRVAPIEKLEITQHDDGLITWGVRFSKPIKGTHSSYSGGKLNEEQARAIIASQFCPYGKPGDRLWVRETHARADSLLTPVHYMADGPIPSLDERHDAGLLRVYPSIHMPRWASRITLEISDVRVERLQDITEADAGLEGCPIPEKYRKQYADRNDTARAWFKELWNDINSKRGFGWDANPWVWVIKFRRIEG